MDTNVLVAAFTTRGFCYDILQVVLAQHRLLVGKTVLEELERILVDKLGVPMEDVSHVVGFVREHAEVVVPIEPASWPSTDPADRWIAAAALRGAADLLVTGDKDFLEAETVPGLRIVSPRGLWEWLRTENADC